MTRALATAAGEAVVILVSERAVLRAELARVLFSPKVVALTVPYVEGLERLGVAPGSPAARAVAATVREIVSAPERNTIRR